VPKRFWITACVCIIAMFAVCSANAQNMSVRADLTEAPRGLIHAALSIPVKPGPLTLIYPKWIPGEHSPTGPIIDVAGLKISAGGKPIAWRRDLTDMYAIHLDVPTGATAVDITLDYLGPTSTSADPATSSQLAVLSWNLIALFPQNSDAAKLMVEPSVVLPPGWSYGCSMETATSPGQDGPITFKPVSLEMLIDQPVVAATHFKQLDLTPGSALQHVIDVAAESDAALAISDERLAAYRRVPLEYAALFNARHYQRYHFLLSLSDRLGFSGLEHHQCSDNRAQERSLIDDDHFLNFASLLTHEYFHSWNGKHRRPAGLLSPDYQKPMEDNLLWVYEGLTEYYGEVMAARTGLWKPDQYREHLASITATLAAKKGRTWRPLQDTADMAPKLYGSGKNWGMRRRGVDFYDEGELIWLDADSLIREKTAGKKSLDDFCRAFYGEGSGGPALGGSVPSVVTYTADDVFRTLNTILPYDWKAFFNERLTSLSPDPPVAGINRGGWKLVYNDQTNKLIEASNKTNSRIDVRFSLGLIIDSDDHTVVDVVPDSPADKAGIGPGMKIIGVDSRVFTDELLQAAIKNSSTTKSVELLAENATYYTNFRLNYSGGARYPHLERVEPTTDFLSKIIEPRAR
jgi:predicted metalloprotease with PDZ domain